MPNIVNTFLLAQLEEDLKNMGSCIVLKFDRLTVELTNEIRNELRDAGVEYRVVKNRLAIRAFDKLGLNLSEAFEGKCGVVMAEEEKAISAAKIASTTRPNPSNVAKAFIRCEARSKAVPHTLDLF